MSNQQPELSSNLPEGIPKLVKPVTPVTVKIATILWAVAGVITVALPAIVAAMLNSQFGEYIKVLKSGQFVSDALIKFNIEELRMLNENAEVVNDTTKYLLEKSQIPSWMITTSIILYVCFALFVALIYFFVLRYMVKGSQTARVIAILLAGASVLTHLFTWISLLSFMWVPVAAMEMTHSHILLMLLHVVALVLIFSPSSNKYFAEAVAVKRLKRQDELQNR